MARSLAFTIEGLALRMLAFSGKKIESWHSVALSPGLLKDGLISAPDRVAKVMAEAVQEKKLPRKGVLSALPSAGSTSHVLTLPRVGGGGLEQVVQREVKRVMPGTANADYIYWQELPGKMARKEVYALAVPRSNVLNLVDACQAAGMKIKGIELKPFSLARAVNCKEGVIVHGEVDSIEIVVVQDSFPGAFRNIAIKETAPTGEVAIQNMLRELPFTIDFFNRTHAEAALSREAPVYLSGELALSAELEYRVADATGRSVASVEPQVTLPPDFPLAQYMAHIGLMLRGKW